MATTASLSAIERLLDAQGWVQPDERPAVVALIRTAVARSPGLDPARVLAVARAIVDLDLQARMGTSTVAEAINYTAASGSLHGAAHAASDALRERIMAIHAMMTLSAADGPVRGSGSDPRYRFCSYCGGMWASLRIKAHVIECCEPVVARWRVREAFVAQKSVVVVDYKEHPTMPMMEAPCGCRYKVFGGDVTALSVKPCLEGNKVLSPRAMARHLGLTKGLDPEEAPTPTGRKPRTWSPR